MSTYPFQTHHLDIVTADNILNRLFRKHEGVVQVQRVLSANVYFTSMSLDMFIRELQQSAAGLDEVTIWQGLQPPSYLDNEKWEPDDLLVVGWSSKLEPAELTAIDGLSWEVV